MKTILDNERRGSERASLKNEHFHRDLQNEKQVDVQKNKTNPKKPEGRIFWVKGKESAKALRQEWNEGINE